MIKVQATGKDEGKDIDRLQEREKVKVQVKVTEKGKGTGTNTGHS